MKLTITCFLIEIYYRYNVKHDQSHFNIMLNRNYATTYYSKLYILYIVLYTCLFICYAQYNHDQFVLIRSTRDHNIVVSEISEQYHL